MRLLGALVGASAGVWTNVIGVVLPALALGDLRARAAPASAPAARSASSVAGALAAAGLPALARPVATLFLPPGLRSTRPRGSGGSGAAWPRP